MAKRKPRVAILDDHDLLRLGVTELLKPNYRIVLSGNTISDLDHVELPPDVVILDLHLMFILLFTVCVIQ